MKEYIAPLKDVSSPFFFAASNSKNGFVSYFPQVFSPYEYDSVIIIKGGPGTGKSSLMKAVHKKALELDHKAEVVLCSSDPSSYDGVIIEFKKKRIALLDGTSPHASDPIFPGACEYIVDLGAFWNKGALKTNRSLIEKVSREKAISYGCAYSSLRAAGCCFDRKKALVSDCIDNKKLSLFVQRLLSKVKAGTQGAKTQYKLKNAISSDGTVSSPIYEIEDGKHFTVCGTHFAEFAFFDMLTEKAMAKDIPILISPSPLCPEVLDAVALPTENMYFCRDYGNGIGTNSKLINAERFIYPTALREIKPKLRAISRDQYALTSSAIKHLAEAKKHHMKLEEVYSSAMNFDAKEEMQEKLIYELFERN